MDKQLIDWLNSSEKNYNVGRALCEKYVPDAQLPTFFRAPKQSDSDYLFSILRQYYYQEKQKRNTTASPLTKIASPGQALVPAKQTLSAEKEITPLAQSCKEEADRMYKSMQHIRAQLFSLCPLVKDDRENDQMLVDQRKSLVLQLAEVQTETDILYSRYRYVLEHNKLPEEGKKDSTSFEIPKNPMEAYKTLLNLRKNYNKLVKKEQTPERVAKIEEHKRKIKLLEDELGKN